MTIFFCFVELILCLWNHDGGGGGWLTKCRYQFETATVHEAREHISWDQTIDWFKSKIIASFKKKKLFMSSALRVHSIIGHSSIRRLVVYHIICVIHSVPQKFVRSRRSIFIETVVLSLSLSLRCVSISFCENWHITICAIIQFQSHLFILMSMILID